MDKQPLPGDFVIFHDSKGRAHNALVTIIYSVGCINAVYVSRDETRTDNYGRQIERTATCMHKNVNQFHGNYWRWPDEAPNEYQAPVGT